MHIERLRVLLGSDKAVAEVLNISQQRVSQLLERNG